MKTVILTALGILIFAGQVNASPACTDFTGHWKGTCVSSAGSQASEVQIEQFGCTAMKTNGVYTAIPGAASTQAVSNDYYSTYLTYVWWSPDAKALEYSINMNVYKNANAQHVFADTIYGANQIVDGKLVASIRDSYGQATCTYEKQ